MSLLERVSTLVKANLNDLLDRSEDPEKMLKQILIDMRNQLIQVKTQVAAAIADEHKLYQRYAENQEQADRWQQKAELAVRKGEDGLAKEALSRRNSYQSIAEGFKQQYDEQKRQVELLKSALTKLEAKIDEAERKKDSLIARSRRAKAEQQIQGTMAGIDNVGVFDTLDRMEEKVSLEEAKAKAATDLASDDLEARFKALEQEDDLDTQLAELKQKVGKGTPANEE